MTSYSATRSYRPARRHGRARFIVLGIVLAVIVALVIAVLANLNTILLLFGKGNVKVKDYTAVEKTLHSSPVYTVTGTDSASASGNGQTLTCVSKDKAVSMQVQQQGDTETVTGTVDTHKLPDVSRSNLSALKKEAVNYLSPVLSESQIVGLGGSMAQDVLSQSRDSLHIDKTYGDTRVVVDSAPGGLLNFKLVTKNK